METLKIHPSAFQELLAEPPAKLAAHTQHLVTYYMEGYEYYRTNIDAEDHYDHQNNEEFLIGLMEVTRQMKITDIPKAFVLKDGDQSINVLPMVYFLDKYSIKLCLSNVDVINNALVEYVHQDNHASFKLAFRTLSQWQSIFKALES